MDPFKTLAAEWPVIRQAPLIYFLTMVAIVVITVLVMRAIQNGQVSAIKERLALRDDKIAELERRVTEIGEKAVLPAPTVQTADIPAERVTYEGDRQDSATPLDANGRTFLRDPVTLRFLANKIKDQTTVQANAAIAPFLGKWMLVKGVVSDVRSTSKDRLVHLFTETQNEFPALDTSVSAWFRDVANNDLDALVQGQVLSIVGRLDDVEQAGITLTDCEMMHG